MDSKNMEMGARKILVVDDNQEFADLVRRCLESKDFKISIALNGKKAIERVLFEIPELVLLDLKLPDVSGEEVLKRIKEIDKDIAVIVMTGYGGEQVAVDMMRKGATDFLSKPIENEVLLTAVKNALEIREAQIEDRKFGQYPSLEKFFPFLAHEIRNPLHAIAGALAIIQKRSDSKDEVLGQSVRIINEEVQHLNDFVQGCLNFVRPPNIVHFTEMDINEVISLVISITSHMFERELRRIRIIKDLDPQLPKIYANYEEIRQAFSNIVKNGLEATPEGGELTIKTRHNSDSPKGIEILFIDDGMGIKKENKGSLFKPFFTSKPRGTGLGLAICHRIIVERHHGKIQIESEEKKGTTVIVELPIGRRSGDFLGGR